MNIYKNRLLLEKWPIPKEHLFIDLIQDLEVKIDKEEYPHSFFLFKGENVWFEIYKKNNDDYGQICCSYKNYWSVFENEYGLNYGQVQLFTNDMVKKYLKIMNLTSLYSMNKNLQMAEEHFKENNLQSSMYFFSNNNTVEKYFKSINLISNGFGIVHTNGVEKHFKSIKTE